LEHGLLCLEQSLVPRRARIPSEPTAAVCIINER
jgi:hypothetical protein